MGLLGHHSHSLGWGSNLVLATTNTNKHKWKSHFHIFKKKKNQIKSKTQKKVSTMIERLNKRWVWYCYCDRNITATVIVTSLWVWTSITCLKFGSSRFHQKSEFLLGEHVWMASQPWWTWEEGELTLMPYAPYVEKKWKAPYMHCSCVERSKRSGGTSKPA